VTDERVLDKRRQALEEEFFQRENERLREQLRETEEMMETSRELLIRDPDDAVAAARAAAQLPAGDVELPREDDRTAVGEAGDDMEAVRPRLRFVGDEDRGQLAVGDLAPAEVAPIDLDARAVEAGHGAFHPRSGEAVGRVHVGDAHEAGGARHARPVDPADGQQQVEAGHPGHLDIGEEDIRLNLANLVEGFFTVGGGGDDIDIFL